MRIRKNNYLPAAAALLAILAASGYLGAKQAEPVKAVSVPITFETLEEEEVAQLDTIERLDNQRKNSLTMIEEVLKNPKASAETTDHALKEKTQIASAMESEAKLEAALAMLGISGIKAVSMKESMTVFSLDDAVFDAKKRMQIVDTAATVTGLPAQNIKIILAKNE